jgi:hypothetical protein
VFHRFLSGNTDLHTKISIRLNGHSIEPFDPFCIKNKATQVLPKEIVLVSGHEVSIQPYILPHHSKLTASEYDFYENRSSFISNQGAYIYRNGRLMAWGDWFRLVPKGEATKLARVQIDFTNELDESWTIDIKKSRARPPHVVRERLRQIIARIADTSIRIHRGRGQRLFQENNAPIWERYADKGNIRYDLNMSHPILDAIKSELSNKQFVQLKSYLSAVSASLPIEMIYSDYSSTPRSIKQCEFDETKLFEKLRHLKSALFVNCELDIDTFRDVISSTRIFDGHEELVEKFIVEEINESE